MRKIILLVNILVLIFTNIFTSTSGDGIFLICPEVSQVKGVSLYKLAGTLYPYKVNETNQSGFLSSSNCLKGDQDCLKLIIKPENYTHGVVQECCSGSCTQAPIVLNQENGELTTETGILGFIKMLFIDISGLESGTMCYIRKVLGSNPVGSYIFCSFLCSLEF